MRSSHGDEAQRSHRGAQSPGRLCAIHERNGGREFSGIADFPLKARMELQSFSPTEGSSSNVLSSEMILSILDLNLQTIGVPLQPCSRLAAPFLPSLLGEVAWRALFCPSWVSGFTLPRGGGGGGGISNTMAGVLDAGSWHHQASTIGEEAAGRPNGGSILETRLGELVGEGVIADYCVCDAAGAVLLAAAGGGGVLEADLRANPALAGQFRAAFSIDAEGAEPCGSAAHSSSHQPSS